MVEGSNGWDNLGHYPTCSRHDLGIDLVPRHHVLSGWSCILGLSTTKTQIQLHKVNHSPARLTRLGNAPAKQSKNDLHP